MKKFLMCCLLLIGCAAYAHPGIGIVMDSKGNVFYTDLKQVWKIDLQGKKSIAVRNVHTHELYIDAHDNLFGEHLWYHEATDAWGHYVWKYSADGKFEKIIPDTEGFLNNYSFVRDKQGNMYWADRANTCQKVTRKNTDGTLTTLGDACMENIRWMTVTDDGIIFLIDLHDLKMIDKQGHVTTLSLHLQEKSWAQFFLNDTHEMMGLTTDKQKNVYATVYSDRQVKKITPAGKVFTMVDTSAAWSPSGVLHAPNGDLWLLECSPTNAVRVERISKDGIREIF